MKLQHSLLAAALLAAVSTSAHAQSTGVVTLGGTIVPSTCTVTLSNGGVYNIGDIDASTLNQATVKDLAFFDQAAEIRCSGPTQFALTAADNKDGTEANPQNFTFGLGQTTTGAKIGHFKLHVVPASVIVDGSAGTMIQSTNLSTWATLNPPWWVQASSAGAARYRAFGSAASGPVAATTVDFTLQVTPSINSRNALQLTGQETMDGSATITIEYI
ncbi:DUF1120 domain-containing protein [Lysobacter sp. A6]|uniref:DUF1120 domain-containing protein n=1 Tax=Noviluteimonas lactosilytica TaxID=2888523 RepID=A0ABS8JGR5_9GAMM|nr:DUF1120 domain-containing protein [Lysobacter lactosilyticus]MCC8362793.1 DUF1120 domain-containing protein [Lysobacter lactosilyticus]